MVASRDATSQVMVFGHTLSFGEICESTPHTTPSSLRSLFGVILIVGRSRILLPLNATSNFLLLLLRRLRASARKRRSQQSQAPRPSHNTMTTAELFLSLPSTPFLLIVCPFLDPCDLLNLRLTCRRTLELLHQEQASEELWRLMLTQNFDIHADFEQTLAIAPLSEDCPSIFGVPPSEAIQQVSSAFEAWKYWIKCSLRFYSSNGRNDCHLKDLPNRSLLLNGPYFLRAAKLWSRQLEWMERPDLSGSVGSRIQRNLSQQRGLFHYGWREVAPCS